MTGTVMKLAVFKRLYFHWFKRVKVKLYFNCYTNWYRCRCLC